MRVRGTREKRILNSDLARLPRIVAIFSTLYVLALLTAGRVSGQPVSDANPSGLELCLVPDSIGEALRRIARRVGGEVGFTAVHLETGARISFNGGRRFPMASVSKIPMALEFLHRVDRGEIDLSEELIVPTTDFRPGYSPLASWSGGRAEQATVDSLFRLMIEVSDNTATDVILRLAGGPDEVTRRLRELGIEEIDVNRSEARTFADLSGIPDTVPEAELYRYNYFRMRDALPPDHRQQARLRFGDDPRDMATPDGAARMLALIHAGEGLSRESRDYLLDAMLESRSGSRRIRGLLPGGTPVAHKTGTIAAAINDIGIITLPGDAGHVAIAAFVYTFYRTQWRRERTIAEMSRLAYDYFSTVTDPREFGPVSTACGAGRVAPDAREPGPVLEEEDAAL
jgi:beta-lactamase class A